MKKKSLIAALVALPIVFAAHPLAFAQSSSMRCWFAPVQAKTHEALIAAVPESFWRIYDSINIKAGSAKLIRDAGAVDVQVIKNSEGLHFLERTAAGNVNVTTISSSPIVTASHSRDVAKLGARSAATPYHGYCRPY
jgi:hypothetical protein